MDLQTKVKHAGRVFKMYAGRLEKLDIYTLEDFLYHIPFRYEDFSRITPIQKITPGTVVTIQGKVIQMRNVFTRTYKKLQEAKVEDTTGVIDIIWFNQQFLTKMIHKDDNISLSGRVELNNNKPTLISPEYEIMYEKMPAIHTGRLVPIYSETKGISSKWLRRQIYKILYEFKKNSYEYLPYSILDNESLMGLTDAIEQIHFPNTLSTVFEAKKRLAFDEVFLLQLAAEVKRHEWKKTRISSSFDIKKFQKEIQIFWEKLPFSLTDAQRKAVHEIFEDLGNSVPMNRLLQGDVGSGKTVVAAIGIYLAFLNGFQSILIAPTEILAEQHFQTLQKLLTSLEVSVALVTGSKKSKVLDFDVLAGTHAILSEKITFKNLGLIVIDEQQRFGVEQRAILRQKGNNPHVLTMTATPIPRTVALTLYGDLDLSVLDQMPKGRKTIKTWLVPDTKRDAGYIWIEERIQAGDQAFIICPFIETSENLSSVKAATVEFERLQKHVFPKLKLGLLHGRIKAKEKDTILEDFKNKKLDILVATPVVEVGIDIPNATIIVIEAAERFGLAQLHQLRGRVGRGDKQSYCLLYAQSQSLQTRERLASLEKIHVGAELAELDLKLRGAGEIFGTLQSGQRTLKIASFSDLILIEKAKKEAAIIYPQLSQYPKLLEKIKEITIKQIAPD